MKEKNIIFDKDQIELRKKLQNIASNLEQEKESGFLNGFFATKKSSSKNVPHGLYIHGSVGCGKTTLMQDFFHSLTKTSKIYFHFNSFMQAIHKALRDIRNEKQQYKDELIEAVRRVVDSKKVLCFDEFQVLDVADAMLLNRIFSYLFSKKIIVIFTSNSAPLNLYQNGLQREIFLEFVNNVLLKNCEVCELKNGVDYRALYRKSLSKRYFISNKENRALLQEIIKNLTKEQKPQPRIIKVWGRDLKIKQAFEKIAIINFDEICKTELAAADYKAIAQEFDLVFLLKLPVLNKEDRNESRRFTLFIDEIYENKTALIILAKTKIDNIYGEEKGEQVYERTISRLKEIKSDQYWQESKIAA